MDTTLSGENQVASKEEEEENEEEADSEESSSDEDEGSVTKAKQALTCRKVTLNMLMEDGIIEAGDSVLTIDYLGQRFEADLLPSGKIKWQGSQEEFGTPSAWALHCKRLVNPIKRSGCGWASVRYKNKKLDIWKSIWARKQRLSSSSKSPQISPGLRLSASSTSLADQAGLSPGLSSPTGQRVTAAGPAAGTSGLGSPPGCSSTAATTSPGSGSATAAANHPSQPAAAPPSSSSSLLSSPPSLAPPSSFPGTTAKQTPPLSSSSTSEPSPNKDNKSDALSEPKTPSSSSQPQSSTTPPRHPAPQPNSQAAQVQGSSEADVQVSPGLTLARKEGQEAPADPPASEASPQVPRVSGDDHSPPKKAKQDDSFGVSLSRELPSPVPGPLPPRAILHQPVRAGQTDQTGLDRQLDQQAWDLLQQGKKRQSVLYSSLGQRGLDIDPFTLIKCEHFDSLSKIQPFTVSITSNTLLLMDFHCHLTRSEVVGYLGGRWDCQKQHLSIEQAFPAKCRLGDKERSSFVEEEIRQSMRQKGMMVVGWYHSHPTCQPDPSLRDLDCQMAYQLRMRSSSAMYLPCVGFIVSPFEKFPPKQDSKIQAFWVMPNLEHPTSFNIPMHVTHSIVRDLSLTEDLLADMKTLCEFYRGAVDKIRLKEQWGEAITYTDKMKASLRSKLPEDQLHSSTFLDYVQQLLVDMK